MGLAAFVAGFGPSGAHQICPERRRERRAEEVPPHLVWVWEVVRAIDRDKRNSPSAVPTFKNLMRHIEGLNDSRILISER